MAGQTTSGPRRLFRRAWGFGGRLFGHALVVAIAGAFLTLGGQCVARDWQRRDNDVRTRDALVERMSAAFGDVLGAIRIHRRGEAADRALDTAFAKWEAESSAVGAQLAAYFPDARVANRWRDFRTLMTEVYYVLRHPKVDGRRTWLHKVNEALKPPPDFTGSDRTNNFQVLNGLLRPPPRGPIIGTTYENARRELLRQLAERADRVVERVLASRSVYS